jgi:Zinc knuckle
LQNSSSARVSHDILCSRVSRIPTSRFGDLRRRCYRCGDSGHVAVDCRNALTYFKCGRLGHISYHCRSITSIPSSSPSFHSPPVSFPPSTATTSLGFSSMETRS